MIKDLLDLTGSLEDRAHTAIDFAKEHDGFENCRLECGYGIFNLSEMISRKDYTESGASDILCEILEGVS